MARKSRSQVEGRSNTSRGRKLYDLQDSETEEELKRFLQQGADFEDADRKEEGGEEPDSRHRPYRIDQPESFGSLGQFWNSEN